jgi:hypothetical protein
MDENTESFPKNFTGKAYVIPEQEWSEYDDIYLRINSDGGEGFMLGFPKDDLHNALRLADALNVWAGKE